MGRLFLVLLFPMPDRSQNPAALPAGTINNVSGLFGGSVLPMGAIMRPKIRSTKRHKSAPRDVTLDLLKQLTVVHKLREQVRAAEAKRRLPSR